jgi:hypothetical protein
VRDSAVALDGCVAPEAVQLLYLASSRNAIETVEQSSLCDASLHHHYDARAKAKLITLVTAAPSNR